MLSFIASVGGADGASASFASATSADYTPLSLIAGKSLLFAVLDCFLSLVAGSSSLSTVSGCFLSLVADGGPFSTISSCLLSSITGSGLVSIVPDSSPLSFMPPANSRALFLTSTLSYVRCSSLSTLALFYSFLLLLFISLAHNLSLFTRKRLFDQAFITQRSIISI